MKFLSVFSFFVVLTVADRVYGDLYGLFDSIKATWNNIVEQIRKPVRVRRLGRGGKRRTFPSPLTPKPALLGICNETTKYNETISDIENVTVIMNTTPEKIAVTTTVVTKTPENLKNLQEVIIDMGIPSNKWAITMFNETLRDEPTMIFDKIEIPIIRKPKSMWKPLHKGHNMYAFGRKSRPENLGLSETESSVERPIAAKPKKSPFDWDKIRTIISEKIKLQSKSDAEVQGNNG